ncbi:lytic transglycosylase domain-containing protein [Sphingomonas sp. SUN039]|uniref:lytic transglycosylase domain-containing protein n=1 Tax=Sphingomonas sp. SUN039 TaxID=2937787 RepID=UPI002164E9A5|nr:lytic transglycosylase domain-containing protein [Sphingomonas sp. SUN039]UVO53787.1 lytic transglycosylase domain-containing protein [Sphingomonas sp. SUN039]
MITPKMPTITPDQMRSLRLVGERLVTAWYRFQAKLFGLPGLPGSCMGLRLISNLHLSSNRNGAEQQFSRLNWFRLPAGILAALVLTTQASAVDARAHRTVVLIDFLRPAVGAVPTENTEAMLSPKLSDVARAMASEFTGAALDDANETARLSMPTSFAVSGAAALRNPFTLYSLPFDRTLTAASAGGVGDCVMPMYRPSLAFGRAAEERRRILFPLVHRAACEAGLPVGLFDALIMKESRYQSAVTSPKGAFGLAQLMPGTALQLGVDRYTLLENLRGGARYLKQHVDRFGRYDLALAAYNAGPERVERRWRVPAIAETQDYVRTIIGNWTGAPMTVAPGSPQSILFRHAQLVFAPARATNF